MAKGLITRAYLEDTADAIRVLRGESNTYTPDEFNEKILDAIPNVEVTDSIVSISDAAAYPAEGLEFAIEPVQDLHGYDKPWPAGGGKNLVNIADMNIISQTTMGRVTLPSGTYVVSATVKNNSNIGGYIRINTSSSSMAQATISDASGTNRIATNSFTLSEPTEIVVVVAGNSSGYNFDVSQVQFELGSTATSYEPYSNICPISGWTGVQGERTGKNLFDETTISDGYYNANGALISATIFKVTDFIPVEKSVLITGYVAGGAIYSVWFDANKVKVGNTFSLTDSANKFVVPQGAKYLRCSINSNTLSSGIFCVSTGTSIPITFPTEAGTVYGGKVDVVQGKLTVHRVITDISTSMSSYSEDSVTVKGFIIIPPIKVSDELVNNIMCDKLKTYVPDYTYRNDIMGVSENNHPTVKGIWIRINKTLLSEISKTGMIQWIQDNNPKLVYELAEPIEYDITPQQVQMLLGDNNIWCDTGDTTLEYKVDLSRYIAKLQAQATPQLSLSRQAVSLDAARGETAQNEDEGAEER